VEPSRRNACHAREVQNLSFSGEKKTAVRGWAEGTGVKKISKAVRRRNKKRQIPIKLRGEAPTAGLGLRNPVFKGRLKIYDDQKPEKRDWGGHGRKEGSRLPYLENLLEDSFKTKKVAGKN